MLMRERHGRPFKIAGLRTTCGCTSVSIDKISLGDHKVLFVESGSCELTVEVDTTMKRGITPFDFAIRCCTEDSADIVWPAGRVIIDVRAGLDAAPDFLRIREDLAVAEVVLQQGVPNAPRPRIDVSNSALLATEWMSTTRPSEAALGPTESVTSWTLIIRPRKFLSGDKGQWVRVSAQDARYGDVVIPVWFDDISRISAHPKALAVTVASGDAQSPHKRSIVLRHRTGWQSEPRVEPTGPKEAFTALNLDPSSRSAKVRMLELSIIPSLLTDASGVFVQDGDFQISIPITVVP